VNSAISETPDIKIKNYRMRLRFIYFFLVLSVLIALTATDIRLNNTLFLALIIVSVIVGLIVRQLRLTSHIKQLSTLNVISRELASSLSIDDVLITTYSHVSRIINVDVYYVALYNDTSHSFEFPFVIENGNRVVWSPTGAGQAQLTEFVLKQKQPLYLQDSNRPQFPATAYTLSNQYRSFVGFPLIVGDKSIGTLCLASNQTDAFPPEVVQMIDTISHQVALTLRNAILYDRSVVMSDSMAKINNFIQGIMFAPDAETVIRSAGEVAVQVARADRVAIFYHYGEVGEQFKLGYALKLLPQHHSWLEKYPYEKETLRTTLGIYDEITSEEARLGDFKSKVEIPLRSGNTPLGLLVVYYRLTHYYRNAELELLEMLAYQITAALDNIELLKTLETYASEQAQLVHLSRISTSTLQLESVIERVSNLLTHMLAVDDVAVGLASNGFMHFYRQGRVTTVQLGQLGNLLTQDTLPIVVPSELQRVLPEQSGTILIAVPLIVSKNIIGLIVVGTSTALTEAERRLLELAANQIALQLHNAQEYHFVQEALDRRLRQLALIEDIAQQISSALNVEQLIGNVLDAAIKATQADMAALALVTENGEFQTFGQVNVEGRWVIQEVTRESTGGIMGQVARSKTTLIIPDNTLSVDYLATFEHGSYHSSLVVPLLKEDQVIGVLDIESIQRGFFKDEHVEFVESLAGHAVISIQNARLLQERQRQIEVLTNLRKLSLKLPSNTDRRSVAHELLKTALTIMQGESAVIFRYHEETEELLLIDSLRKTAKDFTSVSTPLPEAIAYCAVETGDIQVVTDIQTSHFFDGYTYLDRVEYAAVVAAPIKHGNRVQEVLCVTFAHPKLRIEEELNTLELLLIQAAGHLENAVLYEHVVTGNDRLRTFLDSSSEGIILLDAQGNLVQANVSAERLLGVDLSDYAGQNFANRLLDALAVDEVNTDAHEGLRNMARILRLEPERIIRRRFELRGRGQPVYIEEVSSPVIDAQNRSMGRLLILRDVTEEKLLEDYRNEITNMIVHDLRSPLSAIYSGLSYSRVLIDDPEAAEEPHEVIAPVLDVALNSTTSLLSLVDSLLDIAKLETRSMPLKRRSADLYAIVEDVVNTMASLVKEAEIQLQIRVSPDLPQVFIDESKIRRVIVNLLDNAQRFSPQMGVVLIEAEFLQGERKVLMRIADSGRGIPLEEHERVFEKFRQVTSNTPERGRRGSGLGLTFCKLVLEAHGERIWVEADSPLSGASFAFTLPVAMNE
jgi:two-component system, NtrC family, sensor histidine kinase KinB